MKFKLLSYFLVTSTVFSLQAVRVVNETLGTLSIGKFGSATNRKDVIHQLDPVVLEPGLSFDMQEALGTSFTLMTVTVDEQEYAFRELTFETDITFYQDGQGVITCNRFEPFRFVNGSSKTVTIGKFGLAADGIVEYVDAEPVPVRFCGGVFATKAFTQLMRLTISYDKDIEQEVFFPKAVQSVIICDGVRGSVFAIYSTQAQ